MLRPYEALKDDYVSLISAAHIRPECEHILAVTCSRLLHDKAVYQRIYEQTGVPVAVLMALAEREMSGSLHCYFGNGQRLTMRTTIVPKGRGPFQDNIEGFIRGALDALHLDGLDQIAKTSEGWSMPRACYEHTTFNGWGYGILSPYVFGGTTVQRRGKYVRDGVYDPNVMDPQLGTLAIMEELFKQDPSLIFADSVAKVIPAEDAPPIVPVHDPLSDNHEIVWVQKALNALHAGGDDPLLVDGNLGRGTRAVVRAYEQSRHLSVDRGYPGPQVVASLQAELKQKGVVLQ
jgi:lysozyme family protein